MAKQIKYLDLEGLKSLYGVVDSKITTAVTNAKGELKGTATTEYDTLGKLEGKIKDEASRAASAEKANADAIAAMNLTDKAVDGEFITTVSQSDGKVTIARGKVASDKVTAVAVSEGAGTVAIEGATVDAQIKSLGKTLKTVEGNAAKYKVVKLSPTEVAALNDANVKEAYKVVSYVGADVEGTHYTTVGEPIKIYKDGNLKSATLGDNQELILTYTQANGSDATVKVDFAAIAFNAEFKNGLHVATNGEISVQVDTDSEGFLTVGEGGVKLAGVQSAIDAAQAAATTKVVKGGEGTHVTVTAGLPAEDGSVTYTIGESDIASAATLDAVKSAQEANTALLEGIPTEKKVKGYVDEAVAAAKAAATKVAKATDAAHLTVTAGGTAADGSVTYTIGESNIASADALTAEINRAKAAEDKIEASVGLDADGSFTAPTGKNYINGATTVMGAVEKLDVQAKTNADKIAGMSVDENKQTVTIDSKGLEFVALTAEEIRNAVNSAAGN